ncbi:MAG: phosphoribosylglycinamide synthetase C domain-containing protein [bacterium]|nr:phosphoribosylglycinamide synthetase C domain-containing protein [bacterium]
MLDKIFKLNNGTPSVEKKKFLFVSIEALITDIAWQVIKEGHEVRYFIEDTKGKDIGDGFIPKTDDWKKEVSWADVIVFDDVLGQGKKAEQLRRAGKLVIGGTAYTDRLEDDRAFGQEELKNAGVSIIPYTNYSSFDEAIEYVKQNPERYVVKSSGEAQNMKSLLFIGEDEDGRDVIYILDAYKKGWSKKIKSFQLQKRVDGVEVAVGAFFNGKEFAYPINVNFEHKRLFPGNIGPQTGEMGTSMFWSDSNKIFNATLKKMEPMLAKEGYVGYIDINCIVNSNGIYPLEFTARFGYPTISIQQEGILMPIGEFLYELASGTLQKFRARSGFQIGVRILVPPFPFNDAKTFEVNSKDAVIMFKKPNYEGIHLEDAKLVDGEWVITGASGVILIVVGMGQTMKQAAASAYNKIQNIMIPNMYYRTDIGERWMEDSDRLHNWGYLREL